LQETQAVGVLEKDLSFGYQGTIYTNVKAALQGAGSPIKCDNFIGGIGGKNIAKKDIYHCFEVMNQQTDEKVHFMQDGEWGE
jgi:pyruvate ferredoxin oxidoreductase alpha subunit